MEFIGELIRRLRMLRHRGQLDSDLEEEIRLHVELREQQLIDRGLTAVDARRAARLRLGNATRIKEKSHMEWMSEIISDFTQDVAYGARALLRSRALTFVAVISLALGIGANAAIFSLLDAVLLRSLPVKDPGQLVLLGTGSDDGIGNNIVNTDLYSYPFYRELQKRNHVFTDVAAIFSMTDSVHGFVVSKTDQVSTDSEIMHVALVSGTYFPMLGVHADMGRMLNEEDDSAEGTHPVAVISQSFWERAFNRDPDIVGREVKLGSAVFHIVGVAPHEFFGTKVGELPDIWVPTSMTKYVPPGWDFYSKNFTQCLNIIGRLKPGVSMLTATSNVNLLLQQITKGFSDADLNQKNLYKLNRAHVSLTPMANGLSSIRHEFSEPLQILMGVVVLVLLIACANIGNLLLARSTARARELAVRQALGARRSRLIRQLLTESLVLALGGGAIGIGLGAVAIRFLLRMVSGGSETIPVSAGLDLRVLGFTLVVTLATALLFGTVPAFRATRLHLSDSLKDGRGPSATSARNSLAKALVIAQVSLSLVLMVGAQLFLRTLVNLNNIDPGFNREGVLRLNVDAQFTGMKDDDPRLNAMFQQIEARVNALPGVKAASFSAFTFREGSWSEAMLVPGMPGNENNGVHQNVVGDRYFATMKIPLLAGRTFNEGDTATSQHVAVISEHIAKTLFPPGNPIGSHFKIPDNNQQVDYQVIGIVKDVKFSDLRENTKNINYLSYRQRPWSFGDFEVRYSGDFSAVSHAVQQAIHSVNRNLPIMNVTTLDEQVARTMTNQRLVAQISGFFGILAAFLSCIGIYGLMSYTTSRRTNEIGIRIALGAGRSNVRWLVLRETLVLVSAGIVLGVPITLLGRHMIESMLYGLHASDLIDLLASVALLFGVAFLAGFLPAQRASKVNPMVALRYE
ncbi:MAG: ABC transporter permease [Acidobacteria bacterium]|nr:ABC transporter permease [Acidobacteriota bacterium]